VGANRRDLLRRSAVVASQWAVGGSVVLGAAFWFGGPAIIDIMTTSSEVRAEARAYLPWLAIGPVVAVASYMFDGIFIGATMTREMRLTMFQSVVIYVLALLAFLPLFGNHGLWAALMVLNATRGLTMARHYPRAETLAAS
jgi:MATE family multidrug resistance protein